MQCNQSTTMVLIVLAATITATSLLATGTLPATTNSLLLFEGNKGEGDGEWGKKKKLHSTSPVTSTTTTDNINNNIVDGDQAAFSTIDNSENFGAQIRKKKNNLPIVQSSETTTQTQQQQQQTFFEHCSVTFKIVSKLYDQQQWRYSFYKGHRQYTATACVRRAARHNKKNIPENPRRHNNNNNNNDRREYEYDDNCMQSSQYHSAPEAMNDAAFALFRQHPSCACGEGTTTASSSSTTTVGWSSPDASVTGDTAQNQNYTTTLSVLKCFDFASFEDVQMKKVSFYANVTDQKSGVWADFRSSVNAADAVQNAFVSLTKKEALFFK